MNIVGVQHITAIHSSSERLDFLSKLNLILINTYSAIEFHIREVEGVVVQIFLKGRLETIFQRGVSAELNEDDHRKLLLDYVQGNDIYFGRVQGDEFACLSEFSLAIAKMHDEAFSLTGSVILSSKSENLDDYLDDLYRLYKIGKNTLRY